MFKYFLLSALSSTLFLLMGCYDSLKLNSDQAETALDCKSITVEIIEDDYSIGRYQLPKNKCKIVNDTLFGPAGKITEDGTLKAAYLKVPVSHILYFEVDKLNVGRTLLLTGGLLGTAAILAAVLIPPQTETIKPSPPPPPPPQGGSFSCPLIYTLGDSGYKLESETFAGAVFKGIERKSYDVLSHIKPVNGCYKINLVNARFETEYVNQLKLLVVDHSPNVSIIPDFAGNIHTVSYPVLPLYVFDKNANNITGILKDNDGQYWESNLSNVNVSSSNDLEDNVTALFPKPQHAGSVKIIVSGLNTELAYFALERIFAFQGDKRLSWYNKLDSDTKERAKFVNWLMREGMLHLSVWTGTSWCERGVIPDVGPGVEKTQIAILNIADVSNDTLKIRASFRTGLWRLDKIAADYSVDLPVKVNEVAASSAIDEKENDVSELIARPDSAYYVTVNGEQANICFPVPTEPRGQLRTVIAMTQGFYNQWTMKGEESQPMLVDRILSEPFYGSRILIPLWKKEHLGGRE